MTARMCPGPLGCERTTASIPDPSVSREEQRLPFLSAIRAGLGAIAAIATFIILVFATRALR